MIIDEADHAKYECPLGMTVSQASMGSVPCVGARCMAWRWVGEPFEAAKTSAQAGKTHQPPDGGGWIANCAPYPASPAAANGRTFQVWRRPIAQTRGFCGMAPIHPATDRYQEIPE